MCVIIDANAVSEIFGSELFGGKDTRPEAGKQLVDWIYSDPERLVVGGKQLEDELDSASFSLWRREMKRRGQLREYNDKEVDQRAEELRGQKACQSDDAHIIALAQISNARLLYSKDKTLHKDFKNSNLLNDPVGKIFPRGNRSQDRRRRDKILADKNLCKKK